jgi:hypothetical protein
MTCKDIAPHILNLCTRWSGQLQAPATLSQNKEPSIPIEQKSGCTPVPIWALCKREISVDAAGSRIPFPGPPIPRLVAMLFRLLENATVTSIIKSMRTLYSSVLFHYPDCCRADARSIGRSNMASFFQLSRLGDLIFYFCSVSLVFFQIFTYLISIFRFAVYFESAITAQSVPRYYAIRRALFLTPKNLPQHLTSWNCVLWSRYYINTLLAVSWMLHDCLITFLTYLPLLFYCFWSKNWHLSVVSCGKMLSRVYGSAVNNKGSGLHDWVY